MDFLHSITVTVHHRVADRNGDATITDSYVLTGCAISLASRTRAYEQEDFSHDSVQARSILFAPNGSDIRSSDVIELDDGTLWHVWGLPTQFKSPFTGYQPGMQVPIRHLAG